jgi:hypothetical protein
VTSKTCRRRSRRARCIATPGGWRCSHEATQGAGDIYTCREHSRLILMALIDDMLRVETRRMLAFSRWENVAEGHALIEALRRRKAA